MPPRIQLGLALRARCVRANPTVRSSFASPYPAAIAAPTQQRSASILAQLSDNRTAYSKRIRRGRGPASGKGKTAGRGHKGQKQHGKVPRGFEGGQTPLIVVHGKRGFKNNFAMDLSTVPLSRIQSWVAQGRIDPTKPITVRELLQSRCVHRITDGIKLLTNSYSHSQSIDEVPPLKQPLHIVVSRASASAIAAVEKAGGTVTTRYYTKFALKQIVAGKMDPMISLQSRPATMDTPSPSPLPESQDKATAKFTPAAPYQEPALPAKRYQNRLPDATSRKAIEYYRDPARRGYLSHTVEAGKGPSLFFRTPEEDKARSKAFANKAGRTVKKVKDLLW